MNNDEVRVFFSIALLEPCGIGVGAVIEGYFALRCGVGSSATQLGRMDVPLGQTRWKKFGILLSIRLLESVCLSGPAEWVLWESS